MILCVKTLEKWQNYFSFSILRKYLNTGIYAEWKIDQYWKFL